MNKDKKRPAAKKAYEKPLLRKVNISSGIQTLGIGCKISDVAGPGPAPLQPYCGISNGCVTAGS